MLASLRNRYVLIPCFMLVYSIYCIVVSLLLCSPAIDKPCTFKMSLAPPASISL